MVSLNVEKELKNIESREKRRYEMTKEIGIELENLVDKYGIEAVVNTLGVLCEHRGKEMKGLEHNKRNIGQVKIGNRYLKNAEIIRSLNSFHLQDPDTIAFLILNYE